MDEAFLIENGVQPWSEMPLWVPGDAGFLRVSVARACAAGLTLRPLAETLRDTLAWDLSRPMDAPRQNATMPSPESLTPGREAGLLRRWKERAAVRVRTPRPGVRSLKA